MEIRSDYRKQQEDEGKEEPHIVTYALPGHDEGGRLFIYGLFDENKGKNDPAVTKETVAHQEQELDQDNNNTDRVIHALFFCGGFPDHWSTFEPLARRLSSSKNEIISSSCSTTETTVAQTSHLKSDKIISGVCCLPGYDTQDIDYKSSYTFDEMSLSLQSACKTLLATIQKEHPPSNNNSNAIQLTCIFHDWGSFVGAMMVNRLHIETPNTVSRIVFFDVLPPAHAKLRIPREKFHQNIFKGIILMSYTLLFAIGNRLYYYTNFWLTAPIAAIGYCVLFIVGLLPVQWIDHRTFMKDRPKEYTLRKIITLQYPYYELWRGIVTLGLKKFHKTTFSDATLPHNVGSPSDGNVAILYMYGTMKRVMFHDANVITWLKQQQQQKGGTNFVVPVQNAGHWLYRQQEDICYETMCQFIVSG